MKKLAIAMLLFATPAMAQQGTYSGSSTPEVKVEGKECKPVAVVNGVLLWAGDCGKSEGELQNSNPTGIEKK